MTRRRISCCGLFFILPVLSVAILCLVLVFAYRRMIYSPATGQMNGEIESAGEIRTYVLHVPESYNPAAPAPLIISLHGFAEWPAHQMEVSRWNDLADRYGFIVVYPAGTGFPLRWRTDGAPGASDDPQKDVVFISDLIDRLMGKYNIDPARIYANGLSNGGGMAEVLGCALAGRIAAIGGVSGAYLFPPAECNPPRPVPVIAFHGTADPIVSYTGGKSGLFNRTFPSIPDWAQGWAARDGCDMTPQDLPASGEVSGIRYVGCTSGAEVILYTVHGGGHAWPGGGSLPEWLVGRTTKDIDATRVIWDFFMRHPME